MKLAVLLFAFSLSAAGLGSVPVLPLDQGTPTQPTEKDAQACLKVFKSVSLPYHGYGSMTVFREGVLRFTVGGEPLGYDEDGLVRFSPSESISFWLASTEDRALVSKRHQWRIEDPTGVEHADVVRAFDSERTRHNHGLEGILHLRGSLTVLWEETSESWWLELLDRESGESFAFLYRPDLSSDPEATYRTALADCSSGPCALGECKITCNPPLLCQAGCLPGGAPTCSCVSLLPPPEPRPLPLPRN